MMPPFYKFDFSDLPSLIALFTFGPWSALAVEVIKILIKLAMVGTNSMYIGELGNLVSAFLYIFPLWWIYKRGGKSKRSLFLALVISEVIRIAFACFMNAYVTLPMYATAMGLSLDKIITSLATINPGIKNLPTFIMLVTIPFNLIKITLNYLVGVLIISRLRRIITMLFKTSRGGGQND